MAILPIVTYDDPVLRNPAEPVESNTPELQTFIDDLFETMYEASGVGLAAPQVGRSLRIFVVDADAITEAEGEGTYGPRVYINPEIVSDQDYLWDAEEGCLSIPDVREKVTRPDSIRIRYLDRDFYAHEEEHQGWFARVLQHEYDHLRGVLFIDYLGAFRKRLIRNKLNEIKSGNVDTEYSLVPKKSIPK
ncbi:peptide deformylase [Natronogracilivirga saccharolytica]|uniref:Peptide deformylase n=1 Tax=Natronogracilivirga saccharolytica TaxID=2812953 RepID=A0A8J7RIQ8_9BACT|nr:peptide deformylase [Natronogracilivirga saccharolytica]MBP3191370.1 peptide deformylase [Natronogracilivirga saccharolytica]